MARSSPPPPKAELKLPNYEILEVIGKGGMAIVYKAMQKSLDRVVAIKELKDSMQGETAIKRFEREAMAASSMSHENIVSIYDFFKLDRSRYLVMEYVGGVDLATVMAKIKEIPLDIAIIIILQVIRALEYIHANNLVHRDIKPSNIMITEQGLVKLMDFGVVLTPNFEALTLPGTFVGTPRYMSPEQIKGNMVDFRSDIFSAGIIFYELVTGKQLFDASDKTEIFRSITRGQIRNPGRIRAGLPPTITRMISRALRKEPHKRYSTTHELRRTLEDFLGNQKLLTMRHRLVGFLAARRLLAATQESAENAKDPTSTRFANFFFEWLVGYERFGLIRWLLYSMSFAIFTAVMIWWQNPNLVGEAPNSELAGLKVVATPWAKVYVDGRFRELTPFNRPIPLFPGYHKVVLKHPKLGSRSYELPLREGEIAPLAIDFRGLIEKTTRP